MDIKIEVNQVDAVAEAIRVIRAVGRSELLSPAASLEGPARARSQRRASEGVAAAIMACSPPRTRRGRGEDASPLGEEAHGHSITVRAEEAVMRRDKSPGGTGKQAQRQQEPRVQAGATGHTLQGEGRQGDKVEGAKKGYKMKGGKIMMPGPTKSHTGRVTDMQPSGDDGDTDMADPLTEREGEEEGG